MSGIEWLVFTSLIIIVIVFFYGIIYGSIKYFYIKHKYKVCPKCGADTMTNNVKEYIFADIETWEEITCTDLDCDFKHRHKWFD